jgi:hypothetical protein
MNNRNQQTTSATTPAVATAPTYVNVFTVEEYESNGKTGEKWTKIRARGRSPNSWTRRRTIAA